ncbi:helix-turn-helix transcriptional regulator [Streptomyces sp. P6-2-1]|uniref:helix-turn-helix transcriptional regulator n=1 Tax=Streptomyces sp. P6-2-1 TaxID=3422591 RepID=UPI003D368CB9
MHDQFHVLIHSGLKDRFHPDAPAESPLDALRRGFDRIDFVHHEDLAAPGGVLNLPVLYPVTSEFQAEELRTLRVRHPLALLIAVTQDVSGHHTYYAIRSGANCVFNLAIADESQISMVQAQLRAHAAANAAASARADAKGPLPRSIPMPRLPEPDRQLVRDLCTATTVSEIARRHYCSERSMYRRIRRLYDLLGVRGRAELMTLVSFRSELLPTRQAREIQEVPHRQAS